MCVLKSLVFAGGLLVVAAGPLAAQSSAVTEVPGFTAGDAVRVTVWEYPAFSGTFDIGLDGLVVHPIYQIIQLAGLTQQAAEAEFRRVLERYEVSPQFVIEPLFRITISGEVRAPSLYTVTPRTTVLQAIAQAGGLTQVAQIRSVRLLRQGQELRVNLADHAGGGAQFTLQSGDQVIVHRRSDLWRGTIQPTMSAVGSIASLYLAISRIRGRR
jgi:protein involved in polysaccharide export with SLBB domain